MNRLSFLPAIAVLTIVSACAAPDAPVAPDAVPSEPSLAAADRDASRAPLYMVTLRDDVQDVRGGSP